MTHIFILYVPPNSIFFVIFLVLYQGLRKVVLIPNRKVSLEREGGNLSQNPQEDIPFGPIGQGWVTWSKRWGSWESESGILCFHHGRRVPLETKNWTGTGGRRQPIMMPHHLNPTWKLYFHAMLKFGKARTQLLCKDSCGKQFEVVLRFAAGDGTGWWCHISEQDVRPGGRTWSIQFRPNREVPRWPYLGGLRDWLWNPDQSQEKWGCWTQPISGCSVRVYSSGRVLSVARGGGILRYQICVVTLRKT